MKHDYAPLPEQVPSLQSLCINYMRNSKNSQQYALSVNSGEVAHEILYNSDHKVSSSVFCIQTRCTMKDGLYQRGIACGYNVRTRLFLLGTFEGCTCYEPVGITEWSGAIHLKDIVQVISNNVLNYTCWKGSRRNLCEPEDMPYKQTLYIYQAIAQWITKNNDLFGMDLSREFLDIAHGKQLQVPTEAHGTYFPLRSMVRTDKKWKYLTFFYRSRATIVT